MSSARGRSSKTHAARLLTQLLRRLCLWTFALLTSASGTQPALAQAPHFDVVVADAFDTTSTSWDADHLVVDEKLRGTVDDLRRRSREFRRQWALLSRSTRLTVRLRLVPRSPITDAHAATVFSTGPDDSLLADVAIPAGARVPEVLGHEVEHILERLDGAKVEVMHAQGDPSIRRVARSFETARAVLVGRMVAAQFHAR